MKKIIYLFIVVFFVALNNSWASLILDTGPAQTVDGGYSVMPNQWMGRRVHFDNDYYLNRIDGWMNIDEDDTYRVRIYTDSNSDNLPDTILGSWNSVLSETTTTGWQSFSGHLSVLKDVYYWVYFETDTGHATMPWGAGLPDYIGFYAWHPDEPQYEPDRGYYYRNNMSFGLGTKIYGNIIPEPSSMILMGLGLLGAGFIRRKRAKK